MGYPMSYHHASEIMDEITSLAPMFAGVNFGRLGTRGLQWPCPLEGHPGTETLHMESFSRLGGVSLTPWNINSLPSSLIQIILCFLLRVEG
jgi:predicted molibdopterin-dependent oxidoreductase YjgC